MILLENVRVDQLVLFSRFEVHAVLVAELFLQTLEVLIQEHLLKGSDDTVEFIVLLVLAYTVKSMEYLRSQM